MSFPSEKRILIAAEQWFGATGRGLSEGFRNLGWDVTQVDPREHFIMGRTKPLRFAARFLAKQSQKSFNRAIIHGANIANPSLFLTIKGNYVTSDTLRILRSKKISTAVYYPDFHFDHPGIEIDSFTEYDNFITTKSFQIEYLKNLLGADRVHLVHHGYTPLVHRPRYESMQDTDYVADVLYVGNYSPYKQIWIEHIIRNLPDVRLMIVGNGWSKPAAGFPSHVTVIGHHIVGDGFARLLQSARVNIAVHFGPMGPNKWEDFVSTRTFQIPASKGFMLHVDNAEIHSLFEAGSEIDVFSNADELCAKIQHYLARPDLRTEMIEAAYRRCVPLYSYDARAREITDIIAASTALR
jgi:spore maturation protein CgeB